MIDYKDTLFTSLKAFPVEEMTPRKVASITGRVTTRFVESIYETEGVTEVSDTIEFDMSDEEEMVVKVYINIEFEGWTNDLYFCMFEMLAQGFMYLRQEGSYAFGFMYP